MSTPLHYFSKYRYKNDLDLLDTVIKVYSIVVLKENLTGKEEGALRHYLKSGYNPMTIKTILLDLEITKKHLDQINCNLTKKGYLVRHPTNYRDKRVSEKLVELKESFLSKKVNLFTVIFEKE